MSIEEEAESSCFDQQVRKKRRAMKMNRAVAALLVVFLMLGNAGCALIGTAMAAGASYAIYQATK